jgi:hypothetical protein
MNSLSVNDDEAMKRVKKQGDEALNASSLQFFRSVKRFRATTYYFLFNASSALLFKENFAHLWFPVYRLR